MEDQTLHTAFRHSGWFRSKIQLEGVCRCWTAFPSHRRGREIYYAEGPDGRGVLMKWHSWDDGADDTNLWPSGGYAECRRGFSCLAVGFASNNQSFWRATPMMTLSVCSVGMGRPAIHNRCICESRTGLQFIAAKGDCFQRTRLLLRLCITCPAASRQPIPALSATIGLQHIDYGRGHCRREARCGGSPQCGSASHSRLPCTAVVHASRAARADSAFNAWACTSSTTGTMTDHTPISVPHSTGPKPPRSVPTWKT